MSSRHQGVGSFYFACSQCHELEREYKESSNRPQIARFNCHGKLYIRVDIAAAEATVKLNHDILHEKPVDIATPEEMKKEIQANVHMDPVQLRTHLRNKFEVQKITAKQIHYWWSFFTCRFYKLDNDHVISARAFLTKQQGSDLCYDNVTNQVTAIGFTTPLLGILGSVSEVHCDATYKTAKGHFELYGLVGNVQ